MDYKKIADDARESAAICHGAGLKHLSGRILCYADAIEKLLETVEAMKNPHIKIQIDCEELTIKEVCDRLEQLKKRAESAESRVKELEFNRPVQVDGDVFELAEKLAKVTAERDKAVEMLHQSAIRDKSCLGCKNLKTKCDHVYICRCDGEDHWEWEGLDGQNAIHSNANSV